MGLRALCCSKGDKGNDNQESDPPARPSQPRAEKSSQDTPPSVKKDTSLTDVTPGKPTPEEKIEAPTEEVQEKPIQQKPPRRDLWKEAFESLDPSRQQYVASNGVSTTEAIGQVIDGTTAKYEQWQKGGLRIHRKDGDDINLRDCAENILGAAMKFSGLISTAVSFDPTGHASSAWMVISFGMSIVQNRLDRRDAIFAASQYLAETLSYYALIDENYRNQDVGSDHNLDETLLRVYVAILDFTVEVKKGNEENEAKRTFQSVMALTDQPLSTLKDTINVQGQLSEKWISLATNLGDRQKAAEHLAKTDQLLEEMKSLASKAMTTQEESQVVWMSAASYSDRQRALRKKRTGDTGLWLLDSPEYNDWKNVPGSVLWLPGISGCGKSVLCSTIIQDIEENCSMDPSKFLGYWYFQFGVEATQSVDNMFRSLVRQLSRSPLAPAVTKLWEDHHLKGSQPDSEAIFDVLNDLISGIKGEIYLVFDALDECPENEEVKERSSLLSLLERLIERHSTKIHILATSRPEQDIVHKFEQFSKIDLEAHLAEDVKTFVTSCLAKAPLNRWKTDIQNLIIEELLDFKERRFRWAELQIMALENCRKESQITSALKSIPQTLEATYRKVLDGVDANDESLAREILMIICLSPVLLDTQVIADMVELQIPDIIVEICTTSFVNFFDGKVQLAHFSVQEFLVVSEEGGEHHKCQFSAVNGHRYLTEKTVDLLLEETEVLNQASAESKAPFLYAAKHWNVHMAAAGGFNALSPELQAKINRLFTETNVYLNWIRAAESNYVNIDEWSKLFQECQPPIQRATSLGLVQTVEFLLAQDADSSVENSQEAKYSALHLDLAGTLGDENTFQFSAKEGQLDVLQTLLNQKLPLERSLVRQILGRINHRKAGGAKLASVLQTMWDQNLLREQSTENSDEIDPSLMERVMMNQNSGLEIVKILLDWQPRISVPIIEEALIAAICWEKDTLDLLLERCDDVQISPATLEKLKSGRYDYPFFTEGLALLATKRPNEVPIGDAFFKWFAERLDLEAFKALMQVRKSDVHVTQDVLEAAAGNTKSGNVFGLLWPQREPGVVFTESMLCNAVEDNPQAEEATNFMTQHIDSHLTLSEGTILRLLDSSEKGLVTLKILLGPLNPGFSLSERVAEAICAHGDAVEMLSFLANKGFDVAMTEGVVSSAALNKAAGPAVMKYLTKIYQKPLPITEQVLIAAAGNDEEGPNVLKIILQDNPSTLPTDRVFEEGCRNKDTVLLLLGQRQKDPPIKKMINRIAILKWSYTTRDVLQVLLQRNLVNVDESVVETLATNPYALDALLSWKPDSPITEKALIAGSKDLRSMRVLMGVPGGALNVTENVLVAIATQSLVSKRVLEVIKSRTGSLDITEKVIRECIKANRLSIISWLVEQMPESVATEAMWNIWKDTDVKDSTARIRVLMGFLKKTGSRITDSMLQDWPFDPKGKDNYDIGDILKWIDELPELPSTELTAEIFVERCGNEDTETFWEGKQIPVTDHLIQVAERNPIADVEQLKAFLEQKRG
ncbi:unnamed protein product [Penicillium salamii]|nr:unnamed protein product [Penicillium salamii]